MRYVDEFLAVAKIAVDNGPIGGITATADDRRLIVSNYHHDSLSVIDVHTCAVVGTITGTEEPFAVATAAAEVNRAYVSIASAASDAIGVIDLRANTVVARYPLAFSVACLAVSPDGKHVYAGRTGTERADIAVLDTTTGHIQVVQIAAAPGVTAQQVRISPDGQRLYVATNGPYDGQLVVIDAHQRNVLDSIEIGSPIRDVALSPDGGTAYVASCGTDFGTVLDVVDTRIGMVTSTAKVSRIGGFVTQLALSRNGERGYLVSDGGVWVLSMPEQNLVGAIPARTQPSCVAESLDGGRLYIADYSGAVAVFSIGAPDVRLTDPDVTLGQPAQLRLEPALT